MWQERSQGAGREGFVWELWERTERGCLVKSQRDHWAAAAGELRWLGVERFSLRQRAPETRIFAVPGRGRDASFTHAFSCLNRRKDVLKSNGYCVSMFCSSAAVLQCKLRGARCVQRHQDALQKHVYDRLTASLNESEARIPIPGTFPRSARGILRQRR